jgi:P27 family predicted phage terminase small subunit
MGRPTGPAPLPTQEHILRGNPSKKKLEPEKEPNAILLTELPDPPTFLGQYGTAEWYRTGPILVMNRLLNEGDLQVFQAYCMNVELLVQSQLDMQKNGLTIIGQRGRIKNPAVVSFGQATTAIRGFAAEFGLSPSARSRIKLPSEETDPLGLLMGDDDTPDDFNEGV